MLTVRNLPRTDWNWAACSLSPISPHNHLHTDPWGQRQQEDQVFTNLKKKSERCNRNTGYKGTEKKRNISRNLQMQYLFHNIFGATATQPFVRKAVFLITCQSWSFWSTLILASNQIKHLSVISLAAKLSSLPVKTELVGQGGEEEREKRKLYPPALSTTAQC